MAENATVTAGPLRSAIKYGDAAVHLKDFASKHPVPNIVKVSKGQYRNIGVAKSVHSELYLHSVKTSKKILAEGVKLKEGKKTTLTTLEQKYALPVTYQGWFELLSEDGKAIRALQSVQELARVFPHKCLVRENIKAFIAKENGDLALDKTRLIHTGEQLTLVGDTVVPVGTGRNATKKKLLRCFDTKGDTIYLAMEQKGMFSPIAGQGNISGVHNAKGLLEKFRLPILVRLVHGIIPSRLEKNAFTGIFRLLSTYSDETAFVSPLKKDTKMVPISTREPLKFISSQNFEELQDHEETKYYHQRSTKMVASYMNSIHVLVNPPDPSALQNVREESGIGVARQDSQEKVSPLKETKKEEAKVSSRTEEDILFEEVDDIYQYVRDGGKPPPPRPRPSSSNKPSSKNHVSSPTGGSHSNHLISRSNSNGSSPNKTPTSTPNKITYKEFKETTKDSKQNDENYWEEPIYDEIEKYQTKKRRESDLVSAGVTVTVDVQSKEAANDKKRASPTATSPSGTPTASSTPNLLSKSMYKLNTEPVENLRQVYKYKDDSSGSRPSSFNKSDVDEDDIVLPPEPLEPIPPPVPPKRFDYDLDSKSTPKSNPGSLEEMRLEKRPSEEVKVMSRKNSAASLPANTSNVPPVGSNSVNVTLGLSPPTHTSPVNTIDHRVASPRSPASASVVVKASGSSPASSANHLVYNRTSPSATAVVHTNRISLSSPSHLKYPNHPPYVAVARVGDDSRSDNLSTTNNFDQPPTRISTTVKHIQSMYL